MFELNDKVALVTGGSRGIGRAISIALARAGSYVVINFRSGEEAARETLAAVEAAGGEGEILGFDIADEGAVTSSIKDVVKRRGRLDILVNNAGIAIDQLLARVKPADLDATWATNLNGTLFCSKAVIRPMMKAKGGRIINLSSVVAESGNPGQAVYSASKAGIIGLTKTLAREYAKRNITVNAVSPGFIATDMTDGLPEAAREGILAQTPLGRIGDPEDVAAAVLYLASDEAGYVTGQVLRVNGGMYV